MMAYSVLSKRYLERFWPIGYALFCCYAEYRLTRPGQWQLTRLAVGHPKSRIQLVTSYAFEGRTTL